MIKAICFDLWETLVHKPGRAPCQIAYEIINPPKLDYYSFTKKLEECLMKEPYSDRRVGFKKLCLELKIKPSKKLIDLLESIWEKSDQKAKLFPETIEVLQNLKKYKLALISNTTSKSFEKVEKKFKFQKYFDFLAVSFKVGLVKPDPKIFKLVAQKLDLKPQEILMVGDNLIDDIKTAKKLGMQAILIDRANKHPGEKSIKNLKEIFNF